MTGMIGIESTFTIMQGSSLQSYRTGTVIAIIISRAMGDRRRIHAVEADNNDDNNNNNNAAKQVEAALTQLAEIKAGAKRLLVDCAKVEEELKRRMIQLRGDGDSDSSDCHPLVVVIYT